MSISRTNFKRAILNQSQSILWTISQWFQTRGFFIMGQIAPSDKSQVWQKYPTKQLIFKVLADSKFKFRNFWHRKNIFLDNDLSPCVNGGSLWYYLDGAHTRTSHAMLGLTWLSGCTRYSLWILFVKIDIICILGKTTNLTQNRMVELKYFRLFQFKNIYKFCPWKDISIIVTLQTKTIPSRCGFRRS